MNERQARLQALKNRKTKQAEQVKVDQQSQKELLASIASLQDNISALEASLSANGTAYTKSQKDLAQNFTTLREILEAGLNVNNIKDIKQAKEIIVSNLKDLPKPVVNTTKTEIPKWLASEKGIATLNDSVIKVVEALIDLEANIKPKQTADEFVPMRRVVRRGNKLEFDDSYWGGSGGGGGGSSSGGGTTGGLTNAELRATAVDVNIAIPIDVGVKNTADATIDPATEQKQDSAITQLTQISADATSSSADLSAIKASVQTLDDAISGSEMQVDVVGALPAGTNAIGKLAANSGVDIGDVDVTSSVSSTLDHGSNLDIDTTAEQITTTSFAAKFGVTVKSAVDNTDTVYIGNSDVTAGTTAATDGFPLEPGESITLPVNNSNLLYAIGAAANQKVFWSAV